MKFKEALAIEEEAVEAVRQGFSKLRGEITRLTRELNEMRDDYARLNDQYDKIVDAEYEDVPNLRIIKAAVIAYNPEAVVELTEEQWLCLARVVNGIM